MVCADLVLIAAFVTLLFLSPWFVYHGHEYNDASGNTVDRDFQYTVGCDSIIMGGWPGGTYRWDAAIADAHLPSGTSIPDGAEAYWSASCGQLTTTFLGINVVLAIPIAILSTLLIVRRRPDDVVGAPAEAGAAT